MKFKKGVIFGKELRDLYQYASETKFALPAVNVVNTSTVNSVMEAAKAVNSPVIIQFSNGGAGFYAGKGLKLEHDRNAVLGAASGAKHIHDLAEYYGVTVVIHTDHAARKLLPWIDGMLEENRKFFSVHKKPLFSSHMLDLSEDPIDENLKTSKEYLKKFQEVNTSIEIELGVTGGEEDGVDHSGIDNSKLYTQPEEVSLAYETLREVSDQFTIAASFGNVHGVYKPGNVNLTPVILKNSQEYIQNKFKTSQNPVHFVFHGGSGSEPEKIKEALSYGVIKMNIDTDLQWAFWDGIRFYEKKNHGYLQSQIGNPEGDDKPNKKFYDPRVWLREGEKTFMERLKQSFEDLNCVNRN